jgi:hypothetical protein
MEVVMKFRRFLILLSTATVMLPLPISDAKACSCREDPIPPCEEYWQAEAVFAGKAIKKSTFYAEEDEGNSRYKYQRVLVRFSVEQAFKGISGEEVEIVTGMGGGDCGYHFEDGERYVVYAIRDGRDKSRLYAGICNRIKLVAEAEEDFAYFRAIPEAGSGGLVFGKVKKVDIISAEDARDISPKGKWRFTYGHPGEPGGGKPWHGETKIDSSANFTKPIRLALSQPGFMCEHRRPK